MDALKVLTLISLGLISQWAHSVVVLQYHHVATNTPPSTSTTPELFAQHLELIAEQGFQVISMSSFIQHRLEFDGREKIALITFDDAVSSIYTAAYPLLKKYQYPFTVFVNTGAVDEGNAGYMNWEQITDMANNGATIANHSVTHAPMIRDLSETVNDWRDRVATELTQAQKRIREETGQDHQVMAYPYGEYDQPLISLLAERGYLAFGQQSGAIDRTTMPQKLPRFPVSNAFGKPESFVVKLNTRPFPLENYKPEETRLEKPSKTSLSLRLPSGISPTQVNCYGSGVGRIETTLMNGELVVNPDQVINTRRYRYNCTAMSDETGRYYWFSKIWINLHLPID